MATGAGCLKVEKLTPSRSARCKRRHHEVGNERVGALRSLDAEHRELDVRELPQSALVGAERERHADGPISRCSFCCGPGIRHRGGVAARGARRNQDNKGGIRSRRHADLREAERSFARVTLDRRYSTTADRDGEFEFRLRYLPNDCVVDIRAGRDTHPVTIKNCFLPRKRVKPTPRSPR